MVIPFGFISMNVKIIKRINLFISCLRYFSSGILIDLKEISILFMKISSSFDSNLFFNRLIEMKTILDIVLNVISILICDI